MEDIFRRRAEIQRKSKGKYAETSRHTSAAKGLLRPPAGLGQVYPSSLMEPKLPQRQHPTALASLKSMNRPRKDVLAAPSRGGGGGGLAHMGGNGNGNYKVASAPAAGSRYNIGYLNGSPQLNVASTSDSLLYQRSVPSLHQIQHTPQQMYLQRQPMMLQHQAMYDSQGYSHSQSINRPAHSTLNLSSYGPTAESPNFKNSFGIGPPPSALNGRKDRSGERNIFFVLEANL